MKQFIVQSLTFSMLALSINAQAMEFGKPIPVSVSVNNQPQMISQSNGRQMRAAQPVKKNSDVNEHQID